MPLSVLPPILSLSIGTRGRIQISLIRAKENLYNEILPPLKLRSSTESRLVLQRLLISQVADLGIVRPPALSLNVSTQLLLPLLPESSIEVSPLIHPPLVGYSQSITPSSRTLPLRESISVTSNIQPLMSRFSLQTSQKEKSLSVGAEIAEEESGGDTEEEENFFEIMFRGEGLRRIEDGRPAVIYVEEKEGDSIIGVVGTICKRLYREKMGGIPKAEIFSNLEEFRKEIRYIEAGNKITVIQLSEKDWKSLTKEEWNRFFGDRLDQLFSQDFGFIILNYPLPKVLERHRINTIIVHARQLTTEMKRKLTEIVWGFVDIEDAFAPLDVVFDYGREKFEHTLEGIKEIGFFAEATKPHEGEESNEHRWIKRFLVKHLASELIKTGELPKNPSRRQIQSKVETEVKGRFLNAVPDVVVGNDVYEVETLFAEDGEGSNPSDKIIHTIDKYDNSSVNSISVVLSNISFIRHLKMIKKILRMYKKDRKENIKFWTLDLKNERLVSFEEILNIMRELKIQMRASR
jgi:hypothetical protein